MEGVTTEEVRAVLTKYREEVGEYQEHQAVSGGQGANTNLRVVVKGGNREAVLLKVCDEKKEEDLRTQITLLLYFKQLHFFTSYPIPLDHSHEYLLLQGSKKIILFDFLAGEAKTAEKMTAQALTDVGIALGKLHLIPNKLQLPAFAMGIAEMEPFLAETQLTPWAQHPFVCFLRQHLPRYKVMVSETKLPTGILHGDLFPDNMLFEGEKLVAIVDWEEACAGPLLLDVAMTICGCCFPHNQLDPELKRAFLESYNTIRPLTELENELLDDFLDYACLSIAFWRFRHFNVRNPDPSRAHLFEEMFQRISKKNA